jgi:hypothetical protein
VHSRLNRCQREDKNLLVGRYEEFAGDFQTVYSNTADKNALLLVPIPRFSPGLAEWHDHCWLHE